MTNNVAWEPIVSRFQFQSAPRFVSLHLCDMPILELTDNPKNRCLSLESSLQACRDNTTKRTYGRVHRWQRCSDDPIHSAICRNETRLVSQRYGTRVCHLRSSGSESSQCCNVVLRATALASASSHSPKTLCLIQVADCWASQQRLRVPFISAQHS